MRQRDAAVGWPEVVVLPVTYLCNANCDMCALGELAQPQALTDDALEHLFGNTFVSETVRAINFTGGEPTLRQDLPALVERLISVCPQLESFSLNSNGMLARSTDVIRGVIDVARRNKKKLHLFISLDGIGPLHDEIRGRAGAFDATLTTIDAIRGLGISRRELTFGVSATATSKNIEYLHEILAFAVERDLQVSFTFPLETDVYMNNADRRDRFHASSDLVERFAKFLDELERFPEHVTPPLPFYRSLQNTLRGQKRTAPCIFQKGGFFLDPSGKILSCWRSSELLYGTLEEETMEDIWYGERRREITRTMVERFCDTCPSPCYVGFPSVLLADAARTAGEP